MKIINFSPVDHRAREIAQEKDLHRDLNEMHIRLGLLPGGFADSHLSFEMKTNHLAHLHQLHEQLLHEQQIKSDYMQHLNSQFCKFQKLPIEIRFLIWELAFLSDLRPRVHRVVEFRGSVVSNQPISPILHTCRESRALYLSRTDATYDFCTFVNFNIDTIYLTDYMIQEEKFRRFLECDSASRVQKLALREELSCDIPNIGPFDMARRSMMCYMPAWVQLITIFYDDRSHQAGFDLDANLDATIKDLSAREKRKWEHAATNSYLKFQGMMHPTIEHRCARIVSARIC
ncbi:hypothetical protein LZ554_003529 [Drepanopeziza brunnea f. sp. 'monogermtubi']|nr:hypothetical protein LZ554_003529 [Drepanopeziza brunnea f. sp. 'monogermtubi']